VLEAFSLLKDMTIEEQANALNGSLADVSPFVHATEDGNPERSYQCHNLLTAMYLMFYLDLTGGSTIKNVRAAAAQNTSEPGLKVRANIALSAVRAGPLLAEDAA
jgi:hypothetical protein